MPKFRLGESTHFKRGRISDNHVFPDTDIHLGGFNKIHE